MGEDIIFFEGRLGWGIKEGIERSMKVGLESIEVRAKTESIKDYQRGSDKVYQRFFFEVIIVSAHSPLPGLLYL